MAFTKIDIHGNGGDCLLWFGDLLDMRDLEGGGDDLYIRMAKAELEAIADAKRNRRAKVIVSSIICSVIGMLLVDFIGWFTFRMRRAKRRAESSKKSYRDSIGETQKEDLKLPLFDLETVSTATNKFSFQNKIGQGGFGPVYKVNCQKRIVIMSLVAIRLGKMSLYVSLYMIGFLVFKFGFLIGCITNWTRNCSEEAFSKFWTSYILACPILYYCL
ncbi:hypothetical protein ACB092_04G049600 [Castanea dentata]